MTFVVGTWPTLRYVYRAALGLIFLPQFGPCALCLGWCHRWPPLRPVTTISFRVLSVSIETPVLPQFSLN